ncbi:MerR family transcriptional regulator [Pedobacter sp. GR22-6]|uniref:MerR family transcriptional regulator n=1 Tax=Pedobacter sp. GR22-6 TaxID=3127957 RepID=UPI00307CE05F
MKYSISDLEQLSGVQTHTIRIWERRYHALEPLRSAGNTRFYDDQQLKRLLNIVGLNERGMKISQVCALSDQEMTRLLEEQLSQAISLDTHFEYYISQMLRHGMAYDEHHFDALITECIAEYGLAKSYKWVIYPLLVRLGLMWRQDHICPAQEHFMSNILRQKLYKAIDELPIRSSSANTWLLFLPEDEGHDIGLLFAHYVLKAAGQKVIFLGSRVPLTSLEDAMKNESVTQLLLFMIRPRPVSEANSYLTELGNKFSHAKIRLAGNGKLIKDLKLPANVSWFQSIEEFEHIISTLINAN